MKKNRIITVLVSLLSSMTLLATSYEYNGFTFDLDIAAQTATLMPKSSGRYTGNIIVPETFVGPKDIEYTVTAIGNNAFSGCSSMISVSMPITVESIGTSAFSGCTALTTLAIPRLVENIGESAFRGCNNLSSIELPVGVTSIANYLFYGCSSLASVTFGQQVTSIGDYAFQDCSKLASLSLPSRLETIGSYAFSGCTALASLTLPSSVTTVGSYAFRNCSAMSKLTLSNSLLTIGESAFYNTSSLSVLTIPASVITIGNNAFSGCGAKHLVYADGCTVALRTYATAITSVSLPSSLLSIADKAFYDCTQLAAVTLPTVLETIGASAFYNCATLPSVTIPASVSTIGTDAFARSGVALLEYADGCTTALRTYATGITSVVIPITVSSFADGAFSGCNSLENVLIFNVEMWNHLFSKLSSNPFPVAHRLYVNGNLLTALNADFGRDVSNYAFYGCKGLRQVNLTGSITGVQSYAFTQCPDLESVAMASSVAFIGQDAFQGCSSLSSVRLGDGMKTIGKNAFYACSKLNSVSMGNGVTQIGESAFKGCSSLPRLELPATLTSIGQEAFSGCHELASIEIPAGVSLIAEKTFYECKNLQQAVLSDAVTSIGSYAFYGCKRLRTMHLPSATATFSERCFSDCDSLRYIYLGTGVNSIGSYSFANCKSLTGFYIGTVTPPSCQSSAFSGSDPEYASLYVPDESVSLYSNKSPWSSFGTKTGQSSAPVYVTSITLSQPVVIIEEGDIFNLTATVHPSNATNMKVNWTSSNTAVAYVNSKGSGLANVEGRTTITATAADNNGASAKSTVIVSNSFVPLSTVSLSADSVWLAEGKELQLTAGLEPAGATFSELTWSSSDPQVAIVNSVGLIKALKAGEAVITCAASDGMGAQDVCKITVTEAVDPAIGDANEDGNVSVADLAYAVHVIMEELANGADISLYDIDGDGEITIDDVLAIADMILGRTPESVVKLLELSASNLTIGIAETQKLGCLVIPYRYSQWLEWDSSAPEIASVDNDGHVTGLVAGSAIITVTATDGSGLSATCKVTVDGSYGTTDGHSWVDLGLPSGTHWATQNLGALSSSEYGGYYAWGETSVKENYGWATYAHCDGSATTLTKYCNAASKGTRDDLLQLQPGDDAAMVAWGENWCMPTREQLDELFNPAYTTTTWTQQNGLYGRLVTSRSNGNSVFLPAAGYMNGITLSSAGSGGYYATRDLYEDNAEYNYSLNFGSSSTTNDNHTYRCYGQSVRPVFAKYIQISPKSLVLEVDSKATLTASVFSLTGTSDEVTWSSSDERVVSVSPDGVVKGVSTGTAIIYATTKDRLTGCCQIMVFNHSDYTPLQYLNFNGGQLVTDVYMKSTISFQMKMRPIKAGGGAFVGNGLIDDNHDYRFFMYSGSTYLDVMSSRKIGNKLSLGIDYELEFGNNYLKDKSTQTTLLSGNTQTFDYTGNPNALMSVCAENDKAYFYYLKVFDDGELVRDYIPCKRNADGVLGFFDMHTKIFTPVEGAVIAGPEIISHSSEKETEEYTVNGASFKMVCVAGGTFQMGSTDGDSDEKPVHSVTLSSFSIGQTEVTQQLWYAVMGQKPTSDGSQWSTTYGLGDQYPAYYVSWNDIQTFIIKLNQLTGQQFRLPTEAEWEFAARGGNSSKGYTYAGSNTIDDVAWYTSNCSQTHPVGTKQANELGIYDMSGNVWEWCQDWYSSSYYSSSPSSNPTGPTSGSHRVRRGGSWSGDATYCRVAHRNGSAPAYRYYYLGFRLAL